jgi:hypothetical protein
MRQKLIIRILSIASILGCVTTSYEAAKRTADEFASESGRQQRQHVAVDASTAAAAASAVATFSAAAPASTRSQIYGIPTYDALFKWVLSHDDVPSSFFKAFIPGVGIVSSERLDDHMHPVQSLQTLRTFLHQEGTKRTVERLSGATEARVVFPQPAAATDEAATYVHDIEATAFLHEVIGHFDDIKSAFPKVRFCVPIKYR